MFPLICLLPLLLQAPATQPVDTGRPTDAAAVVDGIMKAAGSEVWLSIKRIEFTFNVEQEGKLVVSRKHDWDIRANIDTVTDLLKKSEPVRVDLGQKEPSAGFQQWTNDSYWLLMPLKLRDGGAHVEMVGATRDMPPSRARLRLHFDNVGLTPGDQYILSVDLRNNRIDHWVYMPTPERKHGFTWEDYQDFNGLVLSTNHRADDGKRRIFFTDIRVER